MARSRSLWRRVLLWTLLGLAGAGLLFLLWNLRHLPAIWMLRTSTPEETALMREHVEKAKAEKRTFRKRQTTVPLDRISPLLRAAVIVAEDGTFMLHNGIEWTEIKASLEKNVEQGRYARGGSTITQQLVKNLYLSREKTLLRKGNEAVLALFMDAVLSKNRILELYLNLIEWGPGIFGAEAAARAYFGTSAAGVTLEQAIRLAAVIPNPYSMNPTSDKPWMKDRIAMLARRLLSQKYITKAQFDALGLPEPSPAP